MFWRGLPCGGVGSMWRLCYGLEIMRAKTDYKDQHATLFVAPEVAGPIEAARRAYDPIMAAQIAAHITLAYPQEAPMSELLVARVRIATAGIPPFRLRLGGVAYFGCPEGGIYIAVEDVEGSYRALREEILRPPFKPVDFPPHVTLVHPRTSSRGRDYWEKSRYQVREVEFTVREVAITVFDGTKQGVIETCILGKNRSRGSFGQAVHTEEYTI
jgi:2'-5' RNA ligase